MKKEIKLDEALKIYNRRVISVLPNGKTLGKPQVNPENGELYAYPERFGTCVRLPEGTRYFVL